MTLRYTFTQFFFFIFVFFGLSEAYSYCGCEYKNSRYLMSCENNIFRSFESFGECTAEATYRNNQKSSSASSRNSRNETCICDSSSYGYSVKCGTKVMGNYTDRSSCEADAYTLTPGSIRNLRSCNCSETYNGAGLLNCDGRILMSFASKYQCDGHLNRLFNTVRGR